MASIRTRAKPAAPSIQPGSDNADVQTTLKAKSQENPADPHRRARVLGDIGNRLKKHLAPTGKQASGKAGDQMKPLVKFGVGGLKTKSTENSVLGDMGNRLKKHLAPVQQAHGKAGDQKKLPVNPYPDRKKKELPVNPYPDRQKTKPKLAANVAPLPAKPTVAARQEIKEVDGVKPTLAIRQEIQDVDSAKPTLATPQEIQEVDAPPTLAIPQEIHDVDAADDRNVLLVKEYIQDICDYLFYIEKKFPVKIRYLEGRLINSKMRSVLLDWLVEVHYQFGFSAETLYMASKIMDRYLQKERKITRKQLQLVGVTAMYIAAKFEEVCTPTIVDFSAVSDNAFSSDEVRLMEREMLTSLEYDLSPPPAVVFLRRFSKAAGVSDGTAPMMVYTLAKYIMELTIVEYSTCHLFPSEQAAASLALALLIIEKDKTLKDAWNPTIQHHSRISPEGLVVILKPVVGMLAKMYEEPPKLKAIYNKYARNRMNKVSLLSELKLEAWKDRVVRELC